MTETHTDDPTSESLSGLALADFGFGSEDFDFLASSPEEFVPAGHTLRIPIGQRTSFLASINGHEVEAVCRPTRMILNRVSLTEQKSPRTGLMYKSISGTMNPVAATWSVYIKTKDEKLVEVPLEEFMRQQVNLGRPQDPYNPQRFNDLLRNVGMRFGSEMVLLWQHMGANEERARDLLELCQSQGAKQQVQKMEEPGRIQSVFKFEERGAGLEVTSFELGLRVDRSESRTGQGFQDPIDAMIENLKRSNAMRKKARGLQIELDKAPDLDKEQRDGAQAVIDGLRRASTSYMNNIAGSQESITVDDDGTMTRTGQWFPVSAPMGRFTVKVDGEEKVIDLWKSPDDNATAIVDIDPGIMIDTSDDALGDFVPGDEEPF